MRRRPWIVLGAWLVACGPASGTGGGNDGAPSDAQPAAADAEGLDAANLDAAQHDAAPLDASPLDGGLSDDDAASSDAARGDAAQEVCPIAFTATVMASLRVTGDDQRTAYMNSNLLESNAAPWWQFGTYQVPLYRHPARANVLAIYAVNLINVDGLDRGILADITYLTPDAILSTVVTSSTTRVATASTAGWTDPTFDDSRWAPATVIGPHGIPPWGPVFGVSSASWIWTYNPGGPATSKPPIDRAFARTYVFVHRDGRLSELPEACP
jgi:hypothetical protein